MPFSINLKSEHASAQAIVKLWKRCGALEDTPSMLGLAYPPHITLAVYDQIDPIFLAETCEVLFRNTHTFTFRFEQLGHFQKDKHTILWVSPNKYQELAELHTKIHQVIPTHLCRPNYQPHNWQPHCSIATKIPRSRREEALRITDHPLKPFDVVFDNADCASFPPVEVLYETDLQVDA